MNSSGGASQTDARSAQYEWLADDLGKKSACSIAYFHHPVLSAGAQGDTARMKAMWSLLAKKGVDIVLTGHDHSYQRWVRLDANLQPSGQGTVQFVAGAGGHGVQGAAREDERLAIMYGSSTDAYGALQLKLNPKGAEYRYVNTDGQILDQGVVPCSGTTDASAPRAPGGLTATAAASGQVRLKWTAAWDDTGVSSYAIYRNGEQIATVGGAHTEYVDTNVDLNATYSYRVEAVDPGGRRSAKSEPAAISRPAQATLVFTPAADTYVHADNPSTNYGRAASLLTDGSPDAQSLLRFALRGIKGSVTRATLRVFAGTGSITGYEVHPVANSTWAEGTVTYDTRPEAGGEVAKSGAFGSGGVWTEVDVTALVTGNGQLDLALRSTGTTAISMSSREGANPPQLVVDVDAGAAPAATASPTATGLPGIKPGVGPLPRPSRTVTPADQ